ncbi:hypothetical protein LS66_009570 [Helicobacter sp. MIT 03-1614]|uniref:hypothetical protein n=1 Tax=Helicobacter TaxID=209 RepID=UPI0005145174|nr:MULTISPECIES: hypothetical protein [Helicobacter]MDE7235330.1 hypothetical protein [Helicobacter japonicus]TLD86263.1 hypothetical protein LS66_009570 [Helicobacter sp. MIT 03-1614]TLD89727.1 hypothetical protein LS67_001485 [Helicobacter sp. MIT 03-1616]
MLRINSIETENIRELTKKEKLLRLNFKSWVISVMSGLITQPHIGIYAFVFFFFLIIFFYIIEFFDDDIIDIAFATLQMKTNVSTYYP